MQSKIDDILKQRRAQNTEEDTGTAAEEGDKFFSILRGEANEENFLELQFRNGLQTCFNYKDLQWFNHDPDTSCIDLAFGDFLITLKGRGLAPIFRGVKGKRIAWVKEADTQMQDHAANECFVEEISITPPSDYADEEQAPE